MRQNRFYQLIADPGFGFAFVSLVFYSASGVTAFVPAFAGTLLIMAVKLQAVNTRHAWIKDPRTPLRIAGTSLLLIALSLGLRVFTGTAEAASAASVAGGGLYAGGLASFFSALFFGIANLLLAAQLALPEKPRTIALHKNPETFLFPGYVAVGIASGAVEALPVALLAFIVTLVNCKRNNPPHTRHPVLIYALAELLFAVAAFCKGNYIFCAADVICAFYLVRVDMEMTYGGYGRYFRSALRKTG